LSWITRGSVTEVEVAHCSTASCARAVRLALYLLAIARLNLTARVLDASVNCGLDVLNNASLNERPGDNPSRLNSFASRGCVVVATVVVERIG
jgi:hypothetical protein